LRPFMHVRRDYKTCILGGRSSAEPHAPKKMVAANELVIKSGTSVKHDQRKQKPRSDAVWEPGRILPEIRQQCAFSAKDHWRCAAKCQHSYATRDHSEDDDVEEE